MSPTAKIPTRFSRYLFAGVIAAIANFGSRFIFSRWMPFELAVGAAYGVGMLIGFILMRRYAFALSQRPVAQQAIAYIAVNLLGVAQTVAISSGLLHFVLPASGLPVSPEALAHVIGVAAPVVSSYFGHRWFTFR